MLNHNKIVLIIMIVITTSCTTMEGSWEQAKINNTARSYSEYLSKYPNSKFDSEAKNNLQEIEFSKAEKQNSINSFKEYSLKYPDNKYKDDISSNLSILMYEAIKKLNVKNVEEALLVGANPNHKRFDGASPLIVLAKGEVARVKKGVTLLAIFYGSQKEKRQSIAKSLIKAGAKVTATDSHGKSALDYLLGIEGKSTGDITLQLVTKNKGTTATSKSKIEIDKGLIKIIRDADK